MKLNNCLFVTCFISIATVASAQEKGYYSIGNNVEKLKIHTGTKVADSLFRADKGYYSMEINRNKLRRSTGKDTAYQKRIPNIIKGYYSIGNNGRQIEEKNE